MYSRELDKYLDKPTKIGNINLTLRLRDGWHVITSPEIKGLYAANKSLDKVLEDLAPSLKFLSDNPGKFSSPVKFDKFFEEQLSIFVNDIKRIIAPLAMKGH